MGPQNDQIEKRGPEYVVNLQDLPTRDFEGTEFIVDVLNERFVEKNNQKNEISFKALRDKLTHYELDYNTIKKNIPTFLDFQHTNVVEVTVPQMVDIDPERMAAKYNVPVSLLKGKKDLEIIFAHDPLNLKRLKERINGKLPVFKILGHPFFVDIRMRHHRPKDDFSTLGISFKELQWAREDDSDVAIVPYDPKTHNIVNVEWSCVKAIPEDFVMIEIPFEGKLDPYGYARENDLNIKDYLSENPQMTNQSARVVPWEETPISSIIARNIKKDNTEKNKVATTKQTKKVKKKGKGL